MKNNLVKIMIFTVLLMAASQIGFCETADAVQNTPSELVVMMIKFGKVMFGVLMASVIIYAILAVWNFIANRREKTSSVNLSLNTPQNVDDAIMFFINKNKLD